jgi:tetratricopeptide (TPR) repeat protein/TolB-like protein
VTPFAAAALIAVGVAGATLTEMNRRTPPRPGATGRPTLAVMPFDDRTGDPAADWLSTGVPSMIVTALAQTPGLDVIGTERLEASFRELGRAPSDRTSRGEVARHAGAGALLVGTIFSVELGGTASGRSGRPGLRLDVQLQEVESGRVVAASTGEGADLFSVVDAIARDVRGALDMANRPAGRPLRDVTTASLEAYQLYAKAQRARHNNRMADARTLFEEALRIDPAFTLARAHLLTTLERLGENGAAQAERVIVRSQLDRLPERQRLLAEAIQEYDVNAVRALELLEQLIAKYPDEEEAYDAMVHAYTHARDPAYWRKALAFMQRWARAIPGPGSGHFHNHYGYAYIEHGLFTEAEREFRAYIRVSPDEANGYDSLAELYLMTGRPQLAIEQYEQALRLNPMFGWSHFGRAYAQAALGRYDDAFAALITARSLGARGDVPAAFLQMAEALFQQRVGRYRNAAAHLERARSIARDFADPGAQADVELFDAMLAVERGQYQRAIARADRAVDASKRAGVDIMRLRRSSLAHFLAGLAETAAGRVDAARRRLDEQRSLDAGGDPIQISFRHGLNGEIALREGRLDDAAAAFTAAEYHVASSFAIYPALVTLVNNLPVRDGLARTAAARGDLSAAIDLYRRLNQPDVTSRSNAVFEPRYARAAAELADRAGNTAIGRSELARYAQVWKGGP